VETKEQKKVTDMHGREVVVGSRVRLRAIVGDELSLERGEGEVYSVSGMHGNKNEPMVWIKDHPAHHPKAVEVL
jgi:hypothetical protein